MTKHYLHKPIYSLLLVVAFLTSCNGQTKTQSQTDSVTEAKTNPIGQPKIIRTQSTDTNNGVSCGLQDKAGNLWFGTGGEGVYRYDGKLFTQYTEKDGLSHNYVYSILEDKAGNIWFGTKEGLCRYDGKTISAVQIAVPLGTKFNHTGYGDPPTYQPEIWCMLQDRTGVIWFGTYHGGIYRYNGKNFTRFLDHDGVINNDSVQLGGWIESILEDKEGKIWIGGRSNFGVFRYDGKSIIKFNNPAGEEKWVRPLIQDKAGNIWFGIYSGGVICYDGKTFSRFAEKEITRWIFCMAEDSSGNFWFRAGKTGEDGMSFYNGKSIKYISTKDGLCNNTVCCIVKDRDGNLWFGTKNIGLCRYDGKTFTSFTK